MPEISICVKGGGGVVFPIAGDSEQEWNRGVRIVLYLLGLLWCFIGVALISDVFMGAIEKVTSRKARLFNKKTQRFYTFEVWNATVANLTLMALGSSAPEILLNVIDIFAKEFYLEGLGPSTIVGSAAFNLLMIIAVCIVAIPDGQVRYIKEVTVYMCTATWSVFAYLWLIIILVVFSPHVVEIWEGVLTFLFFPLLTLHAFACDKGWLGGTAVDKPTSFSIHKDMTPEEIQEAEAHVRNQHGQHLSSEQVARILQATGQKVSGSAAKYRVGAKRSLISGKRHKVVTLARSLTRSYTSSRKIVPVVQEEVPDPTCTFAFVVTKFAVLESAGKIALKVKREGDASLAAKVYYNTKDGTAMEKVDYEQTEGWLDFPAGQQEAHFEVKILDDSLYHGDVMFYVELSKPMLEDSGDKCAGLGEDFTASITIIDDEDAGMLSFERDTLSVTQPTKPFELPIRVERKHGTTGAVKVRYSTEADTAIASRDFEESKGELEFESGQSEATIHVTINVASRYVSDRFRVNITEPTGGAKLDDTMDGGAEKNILTVIITPDEAAPATVVQSMAATWDKSKVSHANWASQFRDALSVDGGEDDDDDTEPAPHTPFAWAMHIITLPWKLLFALVPPTDYCGGWICFTCSLCMIGFVTMLINDLASLLGCVMCIPDDITAITLVALGTSLPDTFASKTAATQDPHADASVGNVTGSNSVNVFLGLGLPWMIASIAWAIKGRDDRWDARYQFDPDLDWLGLPGERKVGFVAKAGALSFSVAVFSACASVCIALLAVRRKLVGGELGGPKGFKWFSAGVLTTLWMLYIGLSSYQSLSESGGAKCAE